MSPPAVNVVASAIVPAPMATGLLLQQKPVVMAGCAPIAHPNLDLSPTGQPPPSGQGKSAAEGAENSKCLAIGKWAEQGGHAVDRDCSVPQAASPGGVYPCRTLSKMPVNSTVNSKLDAQTSESAFSAGESKLQGLLAFRAPMIPDPSTKLESFDRKIGRKPNALKEV